MSDEFFKQLETLGRSLDEDGPAKKLTNQNEAAMLDAALAQGSSRPATGIAGTFTGTARWAAAAAALLACSVAAGWYFAEAFEETTPAVESPASEVRVKRRHMPPAPVEDAAIYLDPIVVDPTLEDGSVNKHVTPSAAEALAAANTLRAQRKWKAAHRAYRRVYTRFPHQSESYAARVAAAELSLRHLGQPRDAAKQFAYVVRANPNGSLSAAARHGLARSYRALGQTDRERKTLEDLVARHPSDPLARLAAQRLKDL